LSPHLYPIPKLQILPGNHECSAINETYLVDGRVVDDFVGEPDALLGELLARLVCDLHGALDAPAEPVRLGELDGDQAPGVRLPVVPERLDHVTCSTPIRLACRQLGW
jgi:hypothetical protein